MAARVLFLAFNPSTMADDVYSPFLAGLRYDFTTVCIFYAPLLLWSSFPGNWQLKRLVRLVEKGYFLLITAILLLLNLIDTAWFPYSGKRSTFDVFRMLARGDDAGNNLGAYLADYWYLIVLWLALLYVTHRIYDRLHQAQDTETPSLTQRFVLFSVLTGLLFIGARGGLQMKPLSIQAAAGMTEPSSIPLALNTPYSLFKSIRDEVLPAQLFMTEQQAEQQFRLHREGTDSASVNGMNVVVIILESFSAEYTGLNTTSASHTPFLDSLMNVSDTWTHAYANGKRSIEGIPAVVASIPALMNEPFITSAWNASSINSLASLLHPMKYHSAFFHGGNNGTMGFDNFARLAGYDDYFGRAEYDGPATDYDGHWGIFDEQFFQFMIRKATAEKGPFHYTFFSLSSHHPYTIPAPHAHRFKEGKLPIERSISYADYALQQFFKEAAKQPWFNTTIFLLTADHTGPAEGGYYANKAGMYRIPLIVYRPGHSPQKHVETAQQCDLLPTALHLLEYTGAYAAFGNNLFDSTRRPFAVNYADNVWQLISDTALVQFDGTGISRYFKLPSDSLLKHPVVPIPVSPEERMLKAVLQQYRQSLLHNKLTVH